jgi:hypothetical protein
LRRHACALGLVVVVVVIVVVVVVLLLTVWQTPRSS